MYTILFFRLRNRPKDTHIPIILLYPPPWQTHKFLDIKKQKESIFFLLIEQTKKFHAE